MLQGGPFEITAVGEIAPSADIWRSLHKPNSDSFFFLIHSHTVKSSFRLMWCFCSLRPLDVEFMKALHEKVNIVPVLAKADTLTPSEIKKKKLKVGLLPVSCLLIC